LRLGRSLDPAASRRPSRRPAISVQVRYEPFFAESQGPEVGYLTGQHRSILAEIAVNVPCEQLVLTTARHLDRILRGALRVRTAAA
jgi:hypothetical protein